MSDFAATDSRIVHAHAVHTQSRSSSEPVSVSKLIILSRCKHVDDAQSQASHPSLRQYSHFPFAPTLLTNGPRILKHIWYLQQNYELTKLRRVEFIWSCREPEKFAWFENMLRKLEEVREQV